MTTIGKYRHLSRMSTKDGHFVILAIDHRTNMLEKLNEYANSPLSDADFIRFKQGIAQALAPYSSGALTDPTYGIADNVVNEVFHGQMGLLSPVEVTDYGLHPSLRDMQRIPHWSVKKIKMMGGDGVKLLLPYNPNADKAEEKLDFVREIIADCTRYDIPFFLEPIPYPLDPKMTLSNAELLDISIEMCERFSAMGVDALKLPFPVDHKQSQDEAQWFAACEAVDAACPVPWALLSAGVNFDTFLRQSKIACAAGASGVIVGRAVWAEIVAMNTDARMPFLLETGAARMQALADVCKQSATSWHDRVTKPDTSFDWYETYQASN
ncbi:MAG: tagatose 1,6-diphosphate aldolase [Phototrophicaceae bacterium]